MQSQCYYSRDNVVHGPFSEEQMNDLARQKILRPTDLVWQQPGSHPAAVPAGNAFRFWSETTAALPDWLADVEAAGAEPNRKLVSEPQTTYVDPDWLEDLRLWVGLEIIDRVNEKDGLQAPTATGGLPDWLDGWKTPAKASPPPSVAIPVMATPVAKASASAAAVPIADPVVTPVPAVPREPSPAEKMRDESGFDADTGQILDPVKFRRWQQQARKASPATSNASFLEVFRKGRLAIETWIDDDENLLFILHADMDEIQQDAKIQSVIAEAGKFGKELQDKLLHHLGFMVENRRRYYTAMAERG